MIDLSRLNVLEEKIRKVADSVKLLRQESATLSSRNVELEKKLATTSRMEGTTKDEQEKAAQNQMEVDQLRKEREEVRARVDGLLDDLSQIEI